MSENFITSFHRCPVLHDMDFTSLYFTSHFLMDTWVVFSPLLIQSMSVMDYLVHTSFCTYMINFQNWNYFGWFWHMLELMNHWLQGGWCNRTNLYLIKSLYKDIEWQSRSDPQRYSCSFYRWGNQVSNGVGTCSSLYVGSKAKTGTKISFLLGQCSSTHDYHQQTNIECSVHYTMVSSWSR